jgi:hypothetical protein
MGSRSTPLAALLPTAHLRKIYPLFVQAARERMLAQLTITSAAGVDRGRAFRCGDSVVLYTGAREEEGDAGKTGREWGETWTTGVAAEPHRCVPLTLLHARPHRLTSVYSLSGSVLSSG